MSLFDYRMAQQLDRQDCPFYSLIMAAMKRADDQNVRKLRACWPDIWEELEARYNSPGGLLGGEDG